MTRRFHYIDLDIVTCQQPYLNMRRVAVDAARSLLGGLKTLLKPRARVPVAEPWFHVNVSAFRKMVRVARQADLAPVDYPKGKGVAVSCWVIWKEEPDSACPRGSLSGCHRVTNG